MSEPATPIGAQQAPSAFELAIAVVREQEQSAEKQNVRRSPPTSTVYVFIASNVFWYH